MKGPDKVLFAIVAGIVILVGITLAIVFLRPKPGYLPDDTPEGVTHNYLLALQRREYERAYGYLSSSVVGYPESLQAFTRDVEDHSWEVRGLQGGSASFEIQSSQVSGDSATVSVRETTFYQGGVFGSSQETTYFDVHLRRADNAWKIYRAGGFWVWCWDRPEGCQ